LVHGNLVLEGLYGELQAQNSALNWKEGVNFKLKMGEVNLLSLMY